MSCCFRGARGASYRDRAKSVGDLDFGGVARAARQMTNQGALSDPHSLLSCPLKVERTCGKRFCSSQFQPPSHLSHLAPCPSPSMVWTDVSQFDKRNEWLADACGATSFCDLSCSCFQRFALWRARRSDDVQRVPPRERDGRSSVLAGPHKATQDHTGPYRITRDHTGPHTTTHDHTG